VAGAEFDRGIETSLRRHFDSYRTVRFANFGISDGEIEESGGRLMRHASVRSGA
jgi:hypothetical protein